jgi:hypothetical protein
VDYAKAAKSPLPKGKTVARYIVSSIQNNTHAHPGFPPNGCASTARAKFSLEPTPMQWTLTARADRG